MSVFSDDELAFFKLRNLGRLATVDPSGQPHVAPVGWTYNRELDTIDISGRDFAKVRNVKRRRPAAMEAAMRPGPRPGTGIGRGDPPYGGPPRRGFGSPQRRS